ncbi:MAG: YafY family transcriptional regulator [Xanthomonadales bacterium]|nr:YafY family transcriptional regulator [Xanthomonadales bacterium]
MNHTERINLLHRILSTARYPVPLERLINELECSRATVYRDAAFLRDCLGAPLEFCDSPAGVRYADDEHAGRFELPGLWLSPDELHALLATQQLLAKSGPGDFLAEALEPVRARIHTILSEHADGRHWPMDRVRVITSGTRVVDQSTFRRVASAVLQRQRLGFSYRARSTDSHSQRTASPQRLTHYRNNWYLDAWDHDREGLRSFSLDRISQPRTLSEPCSAIAEAELDQHLASSYGSFSGPPKAWAVIRFSAQAQRWASEERWHSQQQGQLLPDGSYELRLPYSNSRELLMDVLRYGADAQVIEPVSLRSEARIQLQLALGQYQD